MSFAFTKQTSTHVTFITPDQFDQYSKSGYVIFMAAPTAFGTYKAVKITVEETNKLNKPTRIKN